MKKFKPRLSAFPMEIGDSMPRSQLRALVGGSNQSGMTSILNKTEFLVFHDEKISKKFGYNLWEGWQVDGTFSYTGQGKRGNQELKLGNKGLIEADRDGKPIRLIESRDGSATYVGEFILGDPKYQLRDAPDELGDIRKVFVFQLIPISKVKKLDKSLLISNPINLINDWIPPSDTNLISISDSKTLKIERKEHSLQKSFGNYIQGRGIDLKNIKFQLSEERKFLVPDFWIPEMNLIVEAKVSTAREFVRLGIGQILDYLNLARMSGLIANGALLLPAVPDRDLVKLLDELGIILITPGNSDNEFNFSAKN